MRSWCHRTALCLGNGLARVLCLDIGHTDFFWCGYAMLMDRTVRIFVINSICICDSLAPTTVVHLHCTRVCSRDGLQCSHRVRTPRRNADRTQGLTLLRGASKLRCIMRRTVVHPTEVGVIQRGGGIRCAHRNHHPHKLCSTNIVFAVSLYCTRGCAEFLGCKCKGEREWIWNDSFDEHEFCATHRFLLNRRAMRVRTFGASVRRRFGCGPVSAARCTSLVRKLITVCINEPEPSPKKKTVTTRQSSIQWRTGYEVHHAEYSIVT